MYLSFRDWLRRVVAVERFSLQHAEEVWFLGFIPHVPLLLMKTAWLF